MTFLFEKLDVYRLALEFVEDIYKFTKGPKSRDFYKIADQLQRAALSVPLNIAEGNGRRHDKERRQFFATARGSLLECVPILHLCNKINYLDDQRFADLYHKADRIGMMLNKLIK